MSLFARSAFLFSLLLLTANIALAAPQDGPPDELEVSTEVEPSETREGESEDSDEGEYEDSDEGENKDSDEGEYEDSDEGEYEDSDEGEYEESDEDDDSPVKKANAEKVDKMMPALIAGGAICAGGGCLALTALPCASLAALCGGPVVLGAASGGGVLVGALIEDIPFEDSILALSIAAGGTIASSILLGITTYAADVIYSQIATSSINIQNDNDLLIFFGIRILIGVTGVAALTLAAAGITVGSMFLFLPDEIGGESDSKRPQRVEQELPMPKTLQANLSAAEPQMAF